MQSWWLGGIAYNDTLRSSTSWSNSAVSSPLSASASRFICLLKSLAHPLSLDTTSQRRPTIARLIVMHNLGRLREDCMPESGAGLSPYISGSQLGWSGEDYSEGRREFIATPCSTNKRVREGLPGPCRRGLSEAGSSFRGVLPRKKDHDHRKRGQRQANVCSTVMTDIHALLHILDGARRRLPGHKFLKPHPLHPHRDWKVGA